MTNLSDKLLQIIQEGLPAATAGELKKYIEQAQKNETELNNAVKLIGDQNEELKVLRPLRDREHNVAAREVVANVRDVELRIKEEILKVKETHATERVSEIRNLTNTVFQSNRLGYNLNLNSTHYDPAGPSNNYNSTTSNETITGNISKE